jgi:YbbR domain-containing protein
MGTYLRRDGPLLLAALLLAVLVWKYVDDELTETRTVPVRLELKVPKGLTLVSGGLRSVEVVLRGPRGRMSAIDPGEFLARYELPMPAEARSVIAVRLAERDFSGLPDGVEIVGIPESFSVTVERQMEKRVPVRVKREGETAEGYAVIRGPHVQPGEVRVRGTGERLRELEFVETEMVDLGGRRESFSTSVGIETSPEVHCDERVLVVVEIGRAPVLRDVANVEVRMLVPDGFERSVKLEDKSISLRLYGDPGRVTTLDPRSILAMVDIARLAESEAGTHRLPVRVQLPAGVSLAPGARLPRVQVQLGN